MNKEAIEKSLKSAYLWYKEACQAGGAAVRPYKRAFNKAKRNAIDAGIDVEACIREARIAEKQAAKKQVPCDLLE